MANARDLSILAQGASTAGILAGSYGGTGASLSPTTAGNTIFTTDGTNWSSTQKIVQGTSVASTSGTSITFTGLPSWAKRITFMLNGVSISGNTTAVQIQLGTSGGFVSSGYVSNGAYIQASNTVSGVALFTTGFYVGQLSAVTDTLGGALTISSFGSNTWTYSGTLTRPGAFPAALFLSSNPFALGGTLTQVRLTTVNGTDTFDAGSVNIFYE